MLRSAVRVTILVSFVALAALQAAAQNVPNCESVIGRDPFNVNRQLQGDERFITVPGPIIITTAGRSNPQHGVQCLLMNEEVAVRPDPNQPGSYKLLWLKRCGNPIYDWTLPSAYNQGMAAYQQPQPQLQPQPQAMVPQGCPPGMVCCPQGYRCTSENEPQQPTAQANALVSLNQAAGQPTARAGQTDTCKHQIVNGQDTLVCKQAHPNRDKILWSALGAGVTAAIICGTGHCNSGGGHGGDGVINIRRYPAPGPGVWYPPTQP